MKTTTSTIYGAYLQACLFFDQPFELTPFTTLNEKFGVQSGIAPAAGEMPVTKYLAIGNQGHRNATGASGQPYTTSNQHLPSDAALYNMIPFHVRLQTNDLTQNERNQYGLRKEMEINGLKYWLYYLKRLDISTSRPAMTVNVKVNGKVSSRPFVPDSNNLNPVPPLLQGDEVTTSSGEYLAIKSVIEVVLSATEIEAIIEGCRILYDEEGYAIISEIGLVSGVDRQVTGQAAGNNAIQYTEVIAAQVVGILNTYHSLPASNSQVKETMTLGTSDPMLINTGLTS